MNLLLTNDDGISSPGLAALLTELERDNCLFVSAPNRQRSAAGASMTIRGSISAEAVMIPGFPSVQAYAVSGTPVDCVRLGFGQLFPKTDAVISGINLGPNQGTNVLYSGTCQAAQEAAIHGYPAIALSLDGNHDSSFFNLDTAARFARTGLKLIKQQTLPFGCYYSINVPDLPIEKLKGVRYGHLGRVLYEAGYEERRDENGNLFYYECGRRVPNKREYRDTDEYWLGMGYVTVTALGFDCAVSLSEKDEQTITRHLKGDLL